MRISSLKSPASHVRFQIERCASRREGLSLLEVVLALAILAVAAAYLAQSMHLATENAIRAQTISQAEIVAESVMNQIVAGFLPPQPVTWSSFVSPNPFGSNALAAGGEQWFYSIQNVNTEVPGMIGVEVAVQRVVPGQALDGQPDLWINRWIIDPNLGLDVPPDTSNTTDSSSATSGSMSGGVQ